MASCTAHRAARAVSASADSCNTRLGLVTGSCRGTTAPPDCLTSFEAAVRMYEVCYSMVGMDGSDKLLGKYTAAICCTTKCEHPKQ
jgi:hypothetical protein